MGPLRDDGEGVRVGPGLTGTSKAIRGGIVLGMGVRVIDGQMRNHVERSAKQPPLLQKAIAFIHDNAHKEITVSDIAAAVNLTPRSVQYTFRRHLGTTPLEYLRRVRLDRAHRELEAADPGVDTVTAIAGRWGFSHAGRFSSVYKQAFGRPPSRTLRG
jgi:transcriptional regulator GlxA family with amidase domain